VPTRPLESVLGWIRETGWKGASEPHEILVLQIGTIGRVEWVVSARSILSNDFYQYREWLLRIEGEEPVVVDEAHFRFGISGLEFLRWHVLLGLNLMLLSVVVAAAALVRAMARRRSRAIAEPID
jgi:hypothetical protein